MGHPREETLLSLYKASSDNDKETLKLIKEVSEECEPCQRFKRTPSRPKVGLPLASDFNECIALDLKGPLKSNKKYILYFVDYFSRLTRGVIIKDKNPDTIVKSIINNWIIGKGIGPGMPGRFIFDNGTEFNNPQMIDLCEKKLYSYECSNSSKCSIQ